MTTATKMTAQQIADQLNANGYTYYGDKAKAWQGGNVSRIYFGKEYVTLENGTPTNVGQRARAKTIGSSAVEAVEAIING
jgi:hypothetical protein